MLGPEMLDEQNHILYKKIMTQTKWIRTELHLLIAKKQNSILSR